MAGMAGVPYAGAYTATKAAVIALSESWAGELEDADISVSVLCPAFVQTRIYDSQRNRPARYQSDTAKNGNSSSDKSKQMVENGMDVSIVGKRVVEALNDGELYIFTHPNYRDVIQQHSAAIDAAFERAAQSSLLQDIVNQNLDML
jgi:short-subunit dehydrogenase